jgi:acetoacetate decarboxylase
MPDHGRLAAEVLPYTGPTSAPLYPPPPWLLPGSRVVKVMFETDANQLLDWLPPKLTRSSPPYGVITISHHPESPVGPFNLATQHLGCRAGFFIRAFTVQAVTDSVTALSGLREIWGYPCRLGEVRLDVGEVAVTASVSVGGPLLDIELTGLTSVEPDAARLDPVINVRAVPSVEEGKRHDLVQMLQIDPDYTMREVSRGTARVEYAGDAGTNDWAALPCRNVISAISCTVDTEMPLARFVMAY